MEAAPFLIQGDASGEALNPVGEQERAYHEDWLQQLLRRHPEILPAAQIDAIYHPLISIGREVGTDSGPIDNLFITPRGYLVLVETKLWRNPQAKREVVAQAIDYAASLSRWTYSRLDGAVRSYLKAYEKVDLDLLDWVERQCGPVEGGRHFFEETVAKNLRLGRFLTFIVGDRIRQSLVDMLKHVNRTPQLAIDVALVELHCYRWTRGEEWPLLVIPRVMARTQVVERSTIQVTVHQDGTYEVDVSQEKAGVGETGPVGVTKGEEAYWELLAERAPQAVGDMRHLVEAYRATDGVTIDPTKAGLAARLHVPGADAEVTLFTVAGDCVGLQPGTNLPNQLAAAGLDRTLVHRYGDRMREIMKPKGQKEFTQSVTRLDLAAFMAAVNAFIEEIRCAATEPR